MCSYGLKRSIATSSPLRALANHGKLSAGGRVMASDPILMQGALGSVVATAALFNQHCEHRQLTGRRSRPQFAARGLGQSCGASCRTFCSRRWKLAAVCGNSRGFGNDKEDGEDDVEQAMNLNEEIPATSDGFLRRVSSRAYDVRRNLEQSLESRSYDLLESNPWRDDSKPVYVLAQEEDRLLTMRTRRERSEVERELSMLFPKRGSRRGKHSMPASPSSSDSPFRMQVEDVREGVLVFEDADEAARYCSLLDGSCRGIAELEASDVFAMCQKNKALAVLFRRGTVPPQPDRLQQNLKARKHSLED